MQSYAFKEIIASTSFDGFNTTALLTWEPNANSTILIACANGITQCLIEGIVSQSTGLPTNDYSMVGRMIYFAQVWPAGTIIQASYSTIFAAQLPLGSTPGGEAVALPGGYVAPAFPYYTHDPIFTVRRFR